MSKKKAKSSESENVNLALQKKILFTIIEKFERSQVYLSPYFH